MNALLLVLFAALVASTSASAIEVEIPAPSAVTATDPIRGKRVFVDPDTGTLRIADLRTMEVEHAVAVGKRPVAVVVNAVSGTAYVVDDVAAGSISAIDIDTGRVIRRTAVGNRPTHVSTDFPRGELYVSNSADGTVSIVHAGTMKVFADIEVGSGPGASSVDARRGLLYVVSSTRGSVEVIDLEHRRLAAHVVVGRSPQSAIVDEHSGKVYVNNVEDRTVSVIDAGAFEVVRTIPVGTGSRAGAMSSVHRRYYLPNADDNRLSVIDTQEDRIVGLVQVGRRPRAAILSVTEDEVYVFNDDDASVSFIDADSMNVLSTVPTGSQPGAFAFGDLPMTTDIGVPPEQSAVTTTPIPVADTALAIEYGDVTRQRYLHTANSREARLIADGLYGDEWRRTMRFFRVWTKQADGRVPVCQFGSVADAGQTRLFATMSGECESLKADPAWTYEGISHYVASPDADGSCASGTEPLYQLRYADGDGIAHRYVREVGVRDTMTKAGWTAEGDSATGIHACIPVLRASISPDAGIDDTPDVPTRLHPVPRPRLR
jgi:YVTN family beta-propeller protein